jgi:DNA recombination protein Rad52
MADYPRLSNPGPGEGFTEEQIRLLRAPLDPSEAATREGERGRDVSYLEAYKSIEHANRIFGFDGWSYSLDNQGVDVMEGPDGPEGLCFWAIVTVHAGGCTRQDIGSIEIRGGQGARNVRNPDQWSLGRKGAVSDALKRALRSYGEQYGNGLYDKDSEIHAAIKAAERAAQEEARAARAEAARRQAASVGAGPGASHPRTSATPTAASQSAASSTPTTNGADHSTGTPGTMPPNQTLDLARLRRDVKAALEKDPQAEARLPKRIDECTAEELRKVKDWLAQRAQRATEAAPVGQT